MDRNTKQYLPVIKDENLKQPLAWIVSLSYEDLLHWLAYAIWSGDTLPLVESSATDFISQLVHLVRSGSAELRPKFWRIVPILLRSWARSDPAHYLDDLLVLAARLRCATAELDIMLITRERLEGHADEISLRQRCLSALAGLGPTEYSLPVFRDYIRKQEYAPVCYRALYRYDLRNAAKELPGLLQRYKDANALSSLQPILKILLRDYLRDRPEQQGDFVEQTLRIIDSGLITKDFRKLLKAVDFEIWLDFSHAHNAVELWDVALHQHKEIYKISLKSLQSKVVQSLDAALFQTEYRSVLHSLDKALVT